MSSISKIDISENTLRNRGRVLDILLRDRTASFLGKRRMNIIWATDSYQHKPASQIKKAQITGKNGKTIQPRAAKSKEEQKRRTKDKAEVFTPLNIVKKMNDTILHSLGLPKDHTWQDFVASNWLEITCGEAPYIASRYDPVTGNYRQPADRVGFLDMKLQSVKSSVFTKKDWLKYAEIALKSSYGYEWQGDNLLIARENILKTMEDFYKDFCTNKLEFKSKLGLSTRQLEHFAEIISWNIWQMDGLKYVKPMSCKPTVKNPDLANKNQLAFLGDEEPKKVKVECEGCRTNDPFKHTGKYSVIKDWPTRKNVRFVDLLAENLSVWP